MASTVEIIFDGVVAIGPPYPTDAMHQECSRADGPLFAIMPLAARRPARLCKLNHKEKFCHTNMHVPVILTTLGYKGRRPDDEVGKWKVWYPVRERLQVFIDGDALPGELTYERDLQAAEATAPPQPSRDDIAAVSDMRKIFPSRKKLKKEMLQSYPYTPHEVVTQVFVPRGRVRGGGYEYVKNDQRPWVTYLPKRTKEPVAKYALPQVIVSIDADEIIIEAHSLETGEPLDPIKFLLTNQIEPPRILIGNADPRGVHEKIHDQTTMDGDVNRDVDFEFFYDLLEGFDDGGPLPIPFIDRFLVRPCYTTLVEGP